MQASVISRTEKFLEACINRIKRNFTKWVQPDLEAVIRSSPLIHLLEWQDDAQHWLLNNIGKRDAFLETLNNRLCVAVSEHIDDSCNQENPFQLLLLIQQGLAMDAKTLLMECCSEKALHQLICRCDMKLLLQDFINYASRNKYDWTKNKDPCLEFLETRRNELEQNVREVITNLFKSDTLKQVLHRYQCEADGLLQKIISQTKSSLVTLSQFLGGDALLACQDEIMSAFKNIKERLGFLYGNFISKIVIQCKERLNYNSVSDDELKKKIREQIDLNLLHKICEQFGVTDEQIVVALAGSGLSLLTLFLFIFIGMQAISGEGAVESVMNSTLVGGAGVLNGSKDKDVDANEVFAKLPEMMEDFFMNLSDELVEEVTELVVESMQAAQNLAAAAPMRDALV